MQRAFRSPRQVREATAPLSPAPRLTRAPRSLEDGLPLHEAASYSKVSTRAREFPHYYLMQKHPSTPLPPAKLAFLGPLKRWYTSCRNHYCIFVTCKMDILYRAQLPPNQDELNLIIIPLVTIFIQHKLQFLKIQ